MKDFVHLHTHSHYSLLDAACTVKGLVQKAKEYNMSALALTDHGNLFGAIEFYNEARKHGIKPIIGCELYVSTKDHKIKSLIKGEKNYHHLIVLAKNSRGYKNLLKISSLSYKEGFYYKPRIDKETLKLYSSDLIALSACLGGEVPNLILNDKLDKAKAVVCEYKDIFGEDSFFLELQDHGIDKQATVNKALLKIAEQTNTKIVATNDIHYLEKEDREAHDILLCIGSQNKVTDDKRKKYYGSEFYFKSYDEMHDVFADKYPISALENTLLIASSCNIELEFKPSLPNVVIPSSYSKEAYLEHLCNEGLNKRYNSITKELKDRLLYELSVICKMGFAGYFLIVWDFIKWAKEQGISVGPGRGSVAGSLVSYCLYITDIDPIRYGLIFERFLNPGRISMPDIDTDFEYEKRDLVINYVIEKYGKDKVASIITFGALKAKAVIRDVGRVLDIPFGEVDRLAKLIPTGPKATLDKAYNDIEDIRLLIDKNPLNKKLFEIAKKLEGINRHAATHAAGIVIGATNLDELVPLYCDTRTKSILTQFEGKYLEEVGLLKMDFLGLKNLSVINICTKLLKDTKGIDVDISSIALDDAKVYKLLQKGETLGVFQLEGRGVQELMGKLKPSVFEDIIALIALYRPGPLNSGMAGEYISRKHGNKSKIDYKHPLLKPILEETYGVIVYQEQVMEIARIIGGFDMARADELRKAMGKKLKSTMDALRQDFVNGAVLRKIDKSLALELYEHMAEFGEYGFNKSHSAAYAVVTYRTAYLKANFPIEYMMSLLSCDSTNIDKIVEYVNEARRMGITILPPSINSSFENFSIENKKIRFGMSAIKNVGYSSVCSIIKEREKGSFASVFDLCERMDTKSLNKKVLEALIKSGSLDELYLNRATHLALVDMALERGQELREERARGQFSLFDKDSKSPDNLEQDASFPRHVELDAKTLLACEKEVLGFYFSGHPLDTQRAKIEKLKLDQIINLKSLEEGREVFICGLICEVSHLISKKGSEWAKASIEGITGSCEVLFFKEVYKNTKELLKTDNVLYIRGKINMIEPNVRIFALEALLFDKVDIGIVDAKRSKEPFNRGYYSSSKKDNGRVNKTASKTKEAKAANTKGKQINIQIKEDYLSKDSIDSLETLKYFCLDNHGQFPIFLHLPTDNIFVKVKAGDEFSLNANAVDNITKLSCVEKVWLN